ncbi:MAG TPA: hypothetical protein VIX90_00945, partial [Edaphobacter sp.]
MAPIDSVRQPLAIRRAVEMVARRGNGGKAWQRWQGVATVARRGNGGKAWQRWQDVATVARRGNGGKKP